MNLDELLKLAQTDPVLKEELERSKTEDLDTFCKRMQNHEIKDYRPYIYGANKEEHLIKMAEAQICIDELIQLNNRDIIPILIKNKKARIYYKNIALRGTQNEQYGLARLGLFPEILINSNDNCTVYETIKNHSEILPKALDLINYKPDMNGIIEIYFEESPSPPIYYLEKFLNHPQNKNRCEYLHSKYQAITTTPNTIEKTMSLYQLYQSKNILWAKNLPAKIIQYMIDAEEKLKYISEKDFEEICKCRNNLYFQNFIENQKLSQTT